MQLYSEIDLKLSNTETQMQAGLIISCASYCNVPKWIMPTALVKKYNEIVMSQCDKCYKSTFFVSSTFLNHLISQSPRNTACQNEFWILWQDLENISKFTPECSYI